MAAGKKHRSTEVICLVALTLYLFMENKPFLLSANPFLLMLPVVFFNAETGKAQSNRKKAADRFCPVGGNFYYGLAVLRAVLQDDVMAAALDNGGGRNDGQAGFFLQLRDGERTAVAHGRAHLVQRRLHAVGQGPA